MKVRCERELSKMKHVTDKKNLKICLVGSSGGHLTHLYMLKPFWKDKNRFWVTFDKEDARSLLKDEKMYPCYFPTNRNIKNLIRNTFLAIRVLKKEKPDLVHIHTFFPLLSPSILYAAKRCGVKVVATLHDTRFICPCASSLRKGKLCNKCGDGKYLRMVKYACFKESKMQSFIVACIFKYHKIRKNFYKQIDRYICLNDNQINLLEQIGYDSNKIVKKYNFVPDNDVKPTKGGYEIPDRYVVFYGRIGEEKGIRVLYELWNRISDIPLVVMGGGPLEDEFRNWAGKKNNVFYLGYTQHDECLKIVKNSEFVVFPSIWYEGCSMVEIETESLGVGLVATDLGFSSEAIENGINGYKIRLGDIDAFVEKINYLWNNPDECVKIGVAARKDYEIKYMPEQNYNLLIKIYKGVLN